MLISSSLIFFCQSLETEELFQKGNALLEEGHLLEAIDIYAEVVDADSGHMNAYANRGLAYSYLEDYEQAIEDFTKALELDPTQKNPELPTLFLNRGFAYSNAGEIEKAFEDYGQALRMNPAFAEAFCNRGMLNQKQNLMERAMSDYRMAVDCAPESEAGLLAVRLMSELEGRLEERQED